MLYEEDKIVSNNIRVPPNDRGQHIVIQKK